MWHFRNRLYLKVFVCISIQQLDSDIKQDNNLGLDDINDARSIVMLEDEIFSIELIK